MADDLLWRLGKLGCILEYGCAYKGYQSFNYDISVHTQICVHITHHGGIQDAALLMDWDWHVLGKLRLVYKGASL